MKKSICLIVFACVLACFSSVSCKQNSEDVIQTVYITPIWKGSFPEPLHNPEIGWAYYNTTDKKSYIYDGEKWKEMEQDDPNIGNIDNPAEEKKEEAKKIDDKTQQQDENANNDSETQDKQETEDGNINTNNIEDLENNNEENCEDSIRHVEYSLGDGRITYSDYKKDILVYSKTVSSDGIILDEYTYYENGETKTSVHYNENGIIEYEITMYEDGKWESHVVYQKGIKIGETFWSQDQSSWENNSYENGLLSCSREWTLNELGDEIKTSEILYYPSGKEKSVYTYNENGMEESRADYDYYESGTIKTYDYFIYDNSSCFQILSKSFYDNGIIKTKGYRSDENRRCVSFELYDNNSTLSEKRIFQNGIGSLSYMLNEKVKYLSDGGYVKEVYDNHDGKTVSSFQKLQDFDVPVLANYYKIYIYAYDKNDKLLSYVYKSNDKILIQETYYYSNNGYRKEIYTDGELNKDQIYDEQNILLSEVLYSYDESNNIIPWETYTYYDNGAIKTSKIKHYNRDENTTSYNFSSLYPDGQSKYDISLSYRDDLLRYYGYSTNDGRHLGFYYNVTGYTNFSGEWLPSDGQYGPLVDWIEIFRDDGYGGKDYFSGRLNPSNDKVSFYTWYDSNNIKTYYVCDNDYLYSFNDRAEHSNWYNLETLESTRDYTKKTEITEETAYELFMQEANDFYVMGNDYSSVGLADDFIIVLVEYAQNYINSIE